MKLRGAGSFLGNRNPGRSWCAPSWCVVRTEKGFVRLAVENAVNATAPANGRSLGLKISSFILEAHDGRFEASESGGVFPTLIEIPIYGR